MNVKILVCYHKKDELYKNDILIPIHCGRAVGKIASKDGSVQAKDFEWCLENLIGDDSGENISELNREVNEMSAIYWAWKNYDKIGNPDYIGLCHYRRLFNFSNQGNFTKCTNLLEQLNINSKCINDILSNNEFVCRKPVRTNEMLKKCAEAFQKIIKFSDEKYPNLYNSYEEYMNGNEYFCNSMFIMSKEDFFEYCATIFPIMFEFLNNENRRIEFIKYINMLLSAKELKRFKGGEVWLDRITGFFMEYVSNYFFIYLQKKRKTYIASVINTEADIKITNSKSILKNIFSVTNSADGRKKIIKIFGVCIIINKKGV